MKAALFLLAALSASPPAEARPQTLWGPHAVCSTLEKITEFTDLSIGRERWVAKLEAEMEAGNCAIAPQGSPFVIERTSGLFSCIRPPDRNGGCGWTVLRPSDRK